MELDDLEIIYVLENDAMPGMLKIGRTKDLEARVASLSAKSAIPLPFRCLYAAQVEDASFVEHRLHTAFSTHRVSPRREFFRVPIESVVAAIQLVSIRTVAEANIAAVCKASKKAHTSAPEEEEDPVELASRPRAGSDFIPERLLMPRAPRKTPVNPKKQVTPASREDSGKVVMTMARAIAEGRATGSQREIARQYNVGRTTVQRAQKLAGELTPAH